MDDTVAEEQRTLNLLERIYDVYFALDSDWNITYLNAEARKIFGVSLDACDSMALWDALPEVASSFYRKFQQSATNNESLVFEGYYPPADKWFETHTYPKPEGGLDVFLHDITSHKATEMRLRNRETYLSTLLNHFVDAVIAIDATGIVQLYNPAAENLFGFRGEEVIGNNVSMLMTDVDRTHHDESIRRYIRTNKGRVLGAGREVTGRRKDGSTFAAELAVKDMTVEDQKYFIGTIRDITERKQAEQELRAHRDRLEQLVEVRTRDLEMARDRALEANQAKSAFLTNMSHELRTPLNAIIGYSEMIHEEASGLRNSPILDDIRKVHVAGKHLLALINDVLDLSKIEAGKMENFLETFEIVPMLEGVAASVDPLIHANRNRLRIDVSESVGRMSSDLTKVRQVLLNLISNATKFTTDGTITVSAHRERVGNQDESIVFKIADSGIGMTQEQLGKLFQPFVQGDSSTTRRYGGTGLGLAITHRLCGLLGGSIAVESKPGQGSTFTVELPVAGPVSTKSEMGNWFAVGPKVNPQAVRLGIGTDHVDERRSKVSSVLVIDDDANVRDLMERFLTRQGFYAHSACGAEEGIAMARVIQPDVITLDVMMPGKDGWWTLTQLKNDPELSHIPVVMISMVRDKELGYALGASDYLTKPVDQNTLRDTIARNVRGSGERTVLVVHTPDEGCARIRKMLTDEGFAVVLAASNDEARGVLTTMRPDLVITELSAPEIDGLYLTEMLKQDARRRHIPVLVTTDEHLNPDQVTKLHSSIQGILEESKLNSEEFLADLKYYVVDKVRGKNKPNGPAGSDGNSD